MKEFLNGSWKTSIGGIAAALGAMLMAMFLFGGMPQWVGAVGSGLSALGVALLGTMARDNNKTSEQVAAPEALGPGSKGPKGEKGEPGDVGPEGEPGEKGATGRAGAKAGK